MELAAAPREVHTDIHNLEQEFASDSPVIRRPLVRVVEKITRSLPLTKVVPADIPDEEGDFLLEAVTDIVDTLMFAAAEKIIEDAMKTDYDYPVAPDEEADKAIETLWPDDEDDGSEDPIAKMCIRREEGTPAVWATESQPVDADRNGLIPSAEKLLRADADDMVDAEDSDEYTMTDDDKYDTSTIDPVDTFRYIAKANEANMKDEPSVVQKTFVREKAGTAAPRQADDKGTLQYLKSVEGRVLTIMEAAFPSADQREAVKSLIKKEFRREMSKVNRTGEED